LSSIEALDYLVGVPTRSTPVDAGLEAAHEIAGLLFAVTEQTRYVLESAARRLDLTPPQARALLELERPASMRAVAGRLHCDASNLTGIADRLEARGLLARTVDASDRRIKTLVLSESGRRARAELESAVRSGPIMAGLSDAERETLRELLGKLAAGGPC
jgi:DNA-binding MarR family transcriptional regulator